MAAHIRPATVRDLDAAASACVEGRREACAGLVPDADLAGLDARRPELVARWADELAHGAHLWLAVDGTDVVGVAQAALRRDADTDILLELVILQVLGRVSDPRLAPALVWTAVGDADAYTWLHEGETHLRALLTDAGFEDDGAPRASDPPGASERRMVRQAARD